LQKTFSKISGKLNNLIAIDPSILVLSIVPFFIISKLSNSENNYLNFSSLSAV
jgi:hypothetical protein